MVSLKRQVIKILLSVAFVVILVLLILVFFADSYFVKAQRLDKQDHWEKAEEFYKRSTLLNPFNAEYFAGYGDFLLNKDKDSKYAEKVIKTAQYNYGEAIRLNPNYAWYHYSLGNAQIVQTLLIQENIANLSNAQEKELSSRKLNSLIESAVTNFKSAIELDKYNIRNNYFIGYDLARVWNYLASVNRDFLIQRFAYILSQRLYYQRLIYPFIFNTTGDFKILQKITPDNHRSQTALYDFIVNNNLWRYRKIQKKILGSYADKESINEFQEILNKKKTLIMQIREKYKDNKNTEIERKDWQGLSYGGKSAYKEGNMYWTGTINAPVYITVKNKKLKIRLKSESAEGIWPYMIIEVLITMSGKSMILQ